MTTVTVEYFAQAREAAGTGTETVEVPPPGTLQALLTDLARKHGARLAAILLTADGSPAPAVLLAVGDQQVRAGQVVALRDGQTVIVMPAVSGG